MNQTIYFQKKIWELFKDEPDKSKVINQLLENYYTGRVDAVPTEREVENEQPKDDHDKFLKDYSQPGVKPPHPEFGYPCCHKKTPCKHWVYNELDGVWFNELTKETREA